MIIKQVTKMKLHFDNYEEYEQYQEIYKKKGYIITPYGQVKNDNDWWFIAEKEE